MEQVAELSITSDAPGARLFMLGNEAIARGAIEAGVQVVASYPGTPSSEITETLVNAAKKLGIYAEWSINEKVAMEVAMAASVSGLRALAVMKHVGVNVAHDALMSASQMGARGGLVLISADDPGQWSSQNEQDNRYIARQAYIPVLEPASAQEGKDMLADAFRLSEKFNQMFMLRSVTRIGHARSDVTLGEIARDKRQGKFVKDPARWVCLPGYSRGTRRAMIERMARIKGVVDDLPYNRLALNRGARLGIITCGISYGYALEAVRWLGLEGKVSLLKIGTPYPMPEKLTRQLLNSVGEVLVVEELEPFVEDEVKVIAEEAGLVVKIHGKDVIPLAGELSTRRVAEALSRLTGVKPPVDFAALDRIKEETASLLPLRPPTLCAGCPHRASLYAINIACQQYKQEFGVEPVRTGDIGCYALGSNPPLNSDDIAICMGGAFGLASGLSHVIDAPIVAHLGDSTFFHSGIPPLINNVFHKARVTMVVLDNATTGMTGFQPHPGAPGEGPQVMAENIARASGVKFVKVVDSFDLPRLINVLGKAMRQEGPSVVIARRMCNILDQREKRRQAVVALPYEVEAEKCVAGSPPACQATCPLHVDVRGYVGLVRQGKFDEALALIKKSLPFPGIIGRICVRPCEEKCKRAEVEETIAINAIKRSAADYGHAAEDLSIAAEKKESVAIVGGGPAGLMAAYDLRKLGYRVTIFEALPVLGGMMAAGIPEFRLPRNILRNEVSIVEKLGVEVRLKTRVGTDINWRDLRKQFDAVFIAVGAHKGRSPGIENEKVEGVVDGAEFLWKVNRGEKVAAGENVVILGGGNVAIDCARTCVRLGFKDVNIVYRRTRTEMPAISEEVAEAEQEGVKLQFLAGPNRILAKEVHVTGIEFVRMKLGEPDGSGRRRPEPVAGSEFTVKTGLVIAAIGEQPDVQFLSETPGAISNGLVRANRVTLETRLKGVFAGGDAVTGPASVIAAMAAGRKAAISIDRYLKGEPLDTGREGEGPQQSKLTVDTFDIVQEPGLKTPALAAEQRQGNFREVETGFSREEAVREAGRCLQCDCRICINLLGCPALITRDGKAVIDDTQCPGCGVCAHACPHGAIKAGVKDGNDTRA